MSDRTIFASRHDFMFIGIKLTRQSDKKINFSMVVKNNWQRLAASFLKGPQNTVELELAK